MSRSQPAPAPMEQGGHDPRPVVRLPRQGMPGAVIALGAIAIALILFVVLNGQRQRRVTVPQQTAQADGFTPPPPLQVPVLAEPAVPAPVPVIVTSSAPSLPPVRNDPPPVTYVPPVITPAPPAPFVPAPAAPPAEPARDKKAQGAIVYDLGAETPAAGGTTQPSAAAGANASRNGSSGFDDAPAKATTMASRTDVVPIGTQIPIALETPIDTARPGLVRAIASRDTLGFDGRRILIPRGSRFVGEYQSEVRSGQNRVFVTWTRVIRPDGVTIRLGSPAADQLGGSGVPGKVNTFFFQRFAGAVLQSALTVGVNLASQPRSGSVIVGIPSGPISTIGQGLVPNDYRPKITVKQGAALNVFVARDLDFSGLTAGQPAAR